MSLTDLNEIGFEVVVLAAFAVIMITLTVLIRQGSHKKTPHSIDFSDAIAQLKSATEQHVETNAVLALTKTFVDQPDLMNKLSGYSQQTVAAALLHRVNQLSVTIRLFEAALEESQSHYADGRLNFKSGVDRNAAKLSRLYSELEAANDHMARFSQPALV